MKINVLLQNSLNSDEIGLHIETASTVENTHTSESEETEARREEKSGVERRFKS